MMSQHYHGYVPEVGEFISILDHVGMKHFDEVAENHLRLRNRLLRPFCLQIPEPTGSSQSSFLQAL
jgi:hypothetical protein